MCPSQMLQLLLLLLLHHAGASPPAVHASPVFGVATEAGIPYGTGLYCHGSNFSLTNCSTVNLTLTLVRPVFNASTGVAVPTDPRPFMLGIHGGSYSHGDPTMEEANVEYFVRRGWVGATIEYRLCQQQKQQGRATANRRLASPHPLGGSLVCAGYGQFPVTAPYGNTSCASAKTFGLGTDDGCPLSAPPKNGSFFGTLMAWMYPAVRDAKAAVRWVRANAAADAGMKLNVDSNYITAIGGSAGACSVVGLATTREDDYKTEISVADDPSLATTHLKESSSIATGLVQWGGDYVPIYTQLRDPKNESR